MVAMIPTLFTDIASVEVTATRQGLDPIICALPLAA